MQYLNQVQPLLKTQPGLNANMLDSNAPNTLLDIRMLCAKLIPFPLNLSYMEHPYV
jgi:hypothetical protein